ncbi:MAG: hypothetical protein U0894_19090 [Pirellulales bacterium]
MVPYKDPKFEMVPDPSANKPKGRTAFQRLPREACKGEGAKEFGGKEACYGFERARWSSGERGNDEELSSRWCEMEPFWSE